MPRCKKEVKAQGFCSKHYTQYWRENNMERSAYLNLKHNALRRGKHFSLSFEEFLEFSLKFKYLAGRGIEKDSLHIDRIDENKGYSADNIQALTNEQNVRKFLDYYYDEYKRRMNFKFKKNEYTRGSKPNNECPF